MKIANIVHADELVNHTEVEFINYCRDVTSDFDWNLPTLFVGWEFIKEFEEFPELCNINILKHRIVENKIYWEFSFDENKSSHIKGVSSFVKHAPDFYFAERYYYINLDPVFYQLKDNQDLFDVMPKKFDSFYVHKDRMIYAVSEQTIYGFDVEMYKFFKFNMDGIMDRLHATTTGPCVLDPEGEIYEKYYKILPEFSLLKRYLVVLVTN